MIAEHLAADDIQAASSFEGVQQLLARLGYDVSEPVTQTAASLGVADRVAHMIRDARRVAAQKADPGLPPALEAYWLEVTALTADVRKAAVSAFRDKPANVLLLMSTRDFDPLECVLVQKSLRQSRAPGAQVAVSHRLLSVDRRHPSPKHVSVLERMRNKAADPYAQFDRIKDAFEFAEWSEEEFNNRNLFSDYFLKQRLTIRELFPVWHEDCKPAQREFERILQAAGEPATLAPPDYASRFINPVLGALGFAAERVEGEDAEVDYLLRPLGAAKDGPACAGLLVYPWDRPLDRKDDQDRDRAEDVPGIRVVKALEQGKLGWVILTNGKDWRLYCAKANSRASNYYEIDLPATLEREDLNAFRYFYLFFRADAFAPAATPSPCQGGVEGVGEAVCFLDRLRQGSAAFAKELGDRLRGHIFDDVFPYLAQGFVDYRKERFDESTAAGDHFLNDVYDATLTLLYRLLFLLYAESLDLLPAHAPAYAAVSLTRIKEEIKTAAGDDFDAAEKRLKDRYSRSDTDLYKRLAELFKIIDEGSKDHNVPTYNGGLFETAPETRDRSREAAAARFLKKYRVPDFYLARAIDLLARAEDDKTHELVFVDYKALGVRQLGNIYEGLLMYHVVVPRDEWERGFRRPGLKVALVPSNKQRKSTGSYFTPQHIVKYIVSNTVGPLLAEKFSAIAPKLRTAQREYAETREFERKRAEKMHITAPRTDDDIARIVADKHESAAWDLFDLKVLDPAAGSGHFLVETVDFITDKVLDFIAGFPWNPVQVLIDHRVRRPIIASLDEQGIKINEDRLTDVNLIKRLVMKRCVYGVDLNPMAVELAKVSLWLDSFTLGAPLSFLDHHLKCGNSLIGSTIADLRKTIQEQGLLWSIPMEPLERATRNMEQIADLTDATLTEVTKSAETYKQVLAGVEGYRVLLDCLTAEHFGVEGASQLVTEGADLDLERWDRTLEKLPAREKRWIKEATAISAERRFFHWDIDFPDVFFTARREPERRAFDAVVGNPPYISVTNIDDVERAYYLAAYPAMATGRFDVYVLFLSGGLLRLCHRGLLGSINPIKFCVYPYGRSLRTHLLRDHRIQQLIDVSQCTDVFPDPSTYPSILIVGRGGGSADHEILLTKAVTTSSGLLVEQLRRGVALTTKRKAGDFLSEPDSVISVDATNAQTSGVLERLTTGHRTIGEFFEIQQAIRIGSAEARTKTLLDAQGLRKASQKRQSIAYPVLDGENLQRYQILWDGRFLVYDPSLLYNPKTPELLRRKKVLVKRVADRLSAVYERGLAGKPAHPLNTIYVLHPRPGSSVNESLVTTLLNSAAHDYWYRTKYQAICVRGGYVEFRENMKYLPLPAICSHYSPDAEPKPISHVPPNPPEPESACEVLCGCERSQFELGISVLAGSCKASGAFSRLLECGTDSATEEEGTTWVLSEWSGASKLRDLDYFGWEGRYPSWHPDDKSAEDGRWFPNGVAPPLPGNGPGEIPWDLIARVYPSYPLPGIDAQAWEAAAWEDFVELLRKNKSKIGNARIRADLTGRGAITNPSGPMRKLQETFLKYHREVRENRARAAEIDFLIDRIVFRLFDLNLDEQKLILSRVGPGRPLPPRRGRGGRKPKKTADEGPTLFDQ